MGEEIIGFPYGGTSMTVNGFSMTPDRTFPQSSTDIWVNVTIHSLGSNQNQSRFPNHGERKFLVLSFQTAKGVGEAGAWDGFNDSMGISMPNNVSLPSNSNVEGSIIFVLGNGNYTSYQIICRSESQQKALFTVELHNP